jgi:hypothetical protein
MVCLAVSAATVCAQPQQVSPENFAMKAKRHELDRRINEQDYTAFSEAIDLPGPMAVRFLWAYAHSDGWDPQARPKALEAIKRTHGFKEYYQQQLAEMVDKRENILRVEEILIAIGNEEAAAVIAPNLFACGMLMADGEMILEALNMDAAIVLGRMHFSDSPTSVDPHKYGPEENIAWQKWAIAHALVPKEWESRAGVPEWQYKIDPNMKRRQARGGRPPPSSEGRGLPDPNDAIRVWPPKSAANHEHSERAEQSAVSANVIVGVGKTPFFLSAWALWAGAGIAAAVGAAAGIGILRRKRKRE